MRITKLFRLIAVSVASFVALAGLVSQGVSLGGAGSVDQDFIVLNQVASSSLEKGAVGQAETLADWSSLFELVHPSADSWTSPRYVQFK